MRRSDLVRSFLQGDTESILRLDRRQIVRSNSRGLLVAVLVLRGQLDEALALGKGLEADDASGTVSFFLGLGLARSGRIKEAQARIERLQELFEFSGRGKSPRPNTDELVGFFSFQLSGFVEFFQGHASIELAKRALAEAQQSRHELAALARVLAMDLLGHSYVRAGEVRLGVRTLRLAQRAAEAIKHRDFPAAIAISILKYEAAYGLEPARVMSRLYRSLVELQPNDSYSRSELRLELARQAILRGQLRTARGALEAAAPEILGSKNWLQAAWLHLRLAWIAKLEGRPMEVLFSLQSAEVAVRQANDQELLQKIISFRIMTLSELNRDRDMAMTIPEIRSRISKAEEQFKSLGPPLRGIEKRIQLRIQLRGQFGGHLLGGLVMPDQKSDGAGRDSQISGFRVGEDPFGDLLDRVEAQKHERSLSLTRDLLHREYFGILLSTIGWKFSRNLLLLGLPDESVLIVEAGETKLVERGLGGLLGRLLLHLSVGPSTKAQAIETVWGYRYDSARHDRLIAVAATRLRKILGGRIAWVSVHGDRIQLSSEVEVKFWSEFLPKDFRLQTRQLQTRQQAQEFSQVLELSHKSGHEIGRRTALAGLGPSEKARLRIRQLQVLEDLATRGDVGVQDLVSRFGISRASALRDLGELVAIGLLVRTGSTRATRYCRPR